MAKRPERRRLSEAQLPPFDDGIDESSVVEQESEVVPVLSAPRPPQRASAPQREPVHEANHDAPRARTRRRRKFTENNDMFYIPLDEIPEGLSYEWKRYSNAGLEDPFYLSSLREQGWEPVSPKAHPNWLPPGYKEPHIIKGGLILMERPKELTDEARREQRQLARRQMVEAEQRLGMTPKDTLTRQHAGIEPRVVKEYMRPMVVEE